ncbi:MAG: AAA family ATPase, partial [Myxococcales bacterium]|nr:AAA family ATPase [Myxococcales bacterium]
MAHSDLQKSYALALASEERAAHLRDFRGRAALVDHLSGRAPHEGAGRFTLLVGGPGAGKSALAAALSQRLDAAYHFVRAHREPRRFVPALIEQCHAIACSALAKEASSGLLGASSDDLKNALFEALLVLARERGHAEVILDGVDELERPVDLLAFLPSPLPSRAHIVLTARPDLALVATLRARCSPLELVTLSPLGVDELKAQTSLPAAELATLVHKTGGLPLLLFPALKESERTGRVDLARVAASERDLFEGLLAEASRRLGPPANQL